MERRLISSGSEFEERVGYSRAVVAGGHVYVSGTAAVMPDDADPPAGAYEQARRCLERIDAALREAGSGPEHVVRTRIYVTHALNIDEVGRAHREYFGGGVGSTEPHESGGAGSAGAGAGKWRPATTAVVCELLDPRWLVEIEADALVP
jgi:enamine deaminase RidA (YjgF/YER057c/UK114 family)